MIVYRKSIGDGLYHCQVKILLPHSPDIVCEYDMNETLMQESNHVWLGYLAGETLILSKELLKADHEIGIKLKSED
jgi:hypothetical protein